MADQQAEWEVRKRGHRHRFATRAVLCSAFVIGILACGLVSDQPDRDSAAQVNQNSEKPTNTDAKAFPNVAASDMNNTELNRLTVQRQQMVQSQMRGRGITDERVLRAMETVPRHRFVPPHLQSSAYSDHPLPIGRGQTISQPYIVALMTSESRPQPQTRALDVGTGSGYQAAVLSELCAQVYSIEIVNELANAAKARLATLGYENVTVRGGDGYLGWPEQAPFDVIIVAAAPDHIPKPLLDQLATGGRLVIPVGRHFQDLLVVEKRPDGTLHQRKVAPVAFVPMTGEAQHPRNPVENASRQR